MEDDKYDVFIGRDFNRFGGDDERTIEQFKDGVLAGTIAYEALWGEIMPIYDYDEEVPTGNLEEADRAAFDKAITELRAIWGPNATICSFTSTGIKKSDKYCGPFVSHRHIVREVEKFESGAALKQSGRVPKMFDQSIYTRKGGRQLMRVWGGSKEGEDRPMKYIWNGEPRLLKDVNDENPVLATVLFKCSLAQYVGRAPLCEVKCPAPAELLTVGDDDVVALGEDGRPLGSDIKIDTLAQLRELYVIAGKFEEVDRTYDVYRDLVFGGGNIGKELNFPEADVRALIHELAAVCPNNNPRNVDKLFDKTVQRGKNQTRKHLGHLRMEAKKKNEVAYENWLKPLRVASVEADPLMVEIDKLDWKDEELVKFRGFIKTEAQTWISLMRKAEGNEQKIEQHTSERTNRMRIAHLPTNHKFYLSDKKLLHQTYIRGDGLLKAFTEDTIIAVVNGGETIWITADFVESHKATYIKQLPMCPMSILVNIVNRGWIKDVNRIVHEHAGNSELTMEKITEAKMTNMALHLYAQEYRKTNYAQLTGYFPYLTERQKPKPSEVFNLFGGFKYQYEPRAVKYKFADYPKEIEPFIRHVYNILANGNEHIGNYLLVWFAFLLQCPARKPEMALFFISIEGAGKGIIFEAFAKYVMGEDHFLALRKIDDLINHFNAHLEGKRLVTVAETKEGDLANKETHRALKNAITDERTVFTKKGQDAHTAMSYNAIVMFGNNASAISIDAGDRRLCPIQMSNAMIGNMEYFDTLSSSMEQNGYAIFDFLTNLDLTGYDVRHPSMVHGQRVEENQFRVRLVENSLTEPLNFMVSIARHEAKALFIGAQPLDVREGSEEALRCQQGELYKAYADWFKAKHNGETKYLCIQKNFIPEIERLGLVNEKRRWKDAEGQTQRMWCYSFNFTELRDAFRTLLKNPTYDF